MRNHWFLWAVLSAVLLSVFWPAALYPLPGAEFIPPIGLFVGFVPLLWVERRTRSDRKGEGNIFLSAYVAFGLFNLLTTWWVAGAHWTGVLATVLINGFLMASAFSLFAWAARRGGERMAFWVLPALWLCIEYLHSIWDISFPWLDLGHGLASAPWAVSWYAWTGPSGGTVWILAVNAAWSVSIHTKEASFWRRWHLPLVLMAAPVLLSLSVRPSPPEEAQLSTKVAIVQPNLDPYGVKFSTPELLSTVDALHAVEEAEVDWVVLPETFLHQGADEGSLNQWPAVLRIQSNAKRHHRQFIVGAMTFSLVPEPTEASRPTGDGRQYEMYNSALWIDSTGVRGIYHKSKLVAGSERMPFRRYLQPLIGEHSIALGGTSGSLGTQKEREVFGDPSQGLQWAPLICWEQDFSDYTTAYVQKNASILAVLSNDGWWGNTPGHVQHLMYARLRAIETGLMVVRAANTGISAVIHNDGTIVDRLPWDKKGVILASVADVRQEPTYYSRAGNYLGRMALWMAPILLLGVWVKSKTKP